MIPKKTWYRFLFLTLLSFCIWLKFTYPQFSFIDLSVNRNTALSVAKNYLKNEQNIDISQYKTAIKFSGRRSADRYLQKSIGFEKTLEFLKQYDFELFFWSIRFFKEDEKEQYKVSVSAATGEVVGFSHYIKDSDARPFLSREESKEIVTGFLRKTFNFEPEKYVLAKDLSTKYDNRTNYNFVWEHKDVFIRWSPEENAGGAKLKIGATISGEDILAFHKNSLSIPEEFNRDISRKKNVGSNLAVIFRIIFFGLLTASIFFVVVRRNNLVLHTTKRFCIILTFSLFLLQLLSYANEFQNILYGYPTTASFYSYMGRYVVGIIMSTFIVTITILMPCLSGESLRYEAFPEKKRSSFLHYILSTIWSRDSARLIIFGYIVGIVMVGIQSALFAIGEGHLGVWVEYTWMAQLSSSYLPFITALVIGANASFSEEITFRLFSISFGKKILKSTFMAVLISSILWGYGHSTYPVFPMWFRGLEVTILGIFLSFIYLKYGIIPVLVAHYIFDVFWGCSAYLLGNSTPYYFYSSVAIILLPMFLAVVAYILNRQEKERPMQWNLTKHQKYNLNILKEHLINNNILAGKNDAEIEGLKKEINSHGWDIAVVEMAIQELSGGQ